jgi:agmatine deiminase
MSRTLDSTPTADGFRMPGEFEPHAGCWMAWPERPDNWRDAARPAQEAFVAVAEAIAVSEPVTMAVSDAQYERCRAMLSPAVRVVEISTDDSWLRDIGPSFLVDDAGFLRGVDWHFNAWGGVEGGLYANWEHDDRVAQKVLEIERAGRYRASLVLEGGSIHVDGQGTVLTTEECLLNHNRNPELSREQIEAELREYLGVSTVLWLGRGVFGDETDGHIDNLACFARPGVVMLSWPEDDSDPTRSAAEDAERRLQLARDDRGRELEVIRIPAPGPLLISDEEAAGVERRAGTLPRLAGERMAGSYVNFFIATSRVIFPLLDERSDDRAAEILSDAFPGREIVGVPAREILLGGGNIHCITQQVPVRAAQPKNSSAVS